MTDFNDDYEKAFNQHTYETEYYNFDNDPEDEYEYQTCPQCNGSGEGPADRTTCPRCHGFGDIPVLIKKEKDSDEE